MRRSKTEKLKNHSTAKTSGGQTSASLNEGRRVLQIEARAVQTLVDRLDERFTQAVDLLYNCKGKVVVSGMGKSGLIGQKIAATLASTGTPAFFLHPAEGVHGDLGMLARRDTLIPISNSGETKEILQLLPYIERMGVPTVALTGKMGSTLAKHSDVVLDVSVSEEACPMGLAPTASTTATLAMGDALAVALLQKRGFKSEDFAQFHPGGTLGRRLLIKVRDLMHVGDEVPRVQEQATGSAAISEISAKKLGMTTVIDRTGALLGVITDGDLRRFVQQGGEIIKATAGTLASRSPRTIGPDDLAARAVEVMERYSITTLVVTEGEQRIVGVIHLHDLLKNGIV
ncbi:MAG TPA: KpsF/GutQ family sugar-phosphate isomerase [Nitrospiraceae bacterium]|nr:KpsF/GutQ family sugar-phosphate isomerase [Nitrospiraceae bacterium]